MIKKIFAAYTLLALSGCITTNIVPVGEGSYLIHREGKTLAASLEELKILTFKDATDFCERKRSDLKVIGSNDIPRSFGRPAQTSLQFRCIAK